MRIKWRKVLVQLLYYYLLLATTGAFFLFISAFFFVYDGNTGHEIFWSVIKQRIGYEGLLLAYNLLGLFLIIILKRRKDNMDTLRFALAYILFLAFFIMPSVLLLASIFADAADFG